MLDYFTATTWQAIGALGAFIGALIGIPKAAQLWHQKRVNNFNEMLRGAEEFQGLKKKVDEYTDRTVQAEGNINLLAQKLDIFINEQRKWQESMLQNAHEQKEESKEINNWIKDRYASTESKQRYKLWPWNRD